MQILPAKIYNTRNYNPVFGVNLSSPKLKFCNEDFFVTIKGYGRNFKWAEQIKLLADEAVKLIRKNEFFDNILKYIANGVRTANQIPLDYAKRIHSGILRTSRNGWETGYWKEHPLITRYNTLKYVPKNHSINRYKDYILRINETVNNPLKNPYGDICLTKPYHIIGDGSFLLHGEPKKINNALNRVHGLYLNLQNRYIKKEPQAKDLPEINSYIAEIRWILAHATPWERGSDAISNILMRSLYKSIGVKSYPLKKGVSLDMEAYCTELKDYKENFASYFVKEPHIIE